MCPAAAHRHRRGWGARGAGGEGREGRAGPEWGQPGRTGESVAMGEAMEAAATRALLRIVLWVLSCTWWIWPGKDRKESAEGTAPLREDRACSAGASRETCIVTGTSLQNAPVTRHPGPATCIPGGPLAEPRLLSEGDTRAQPELTLKYELPSSPTPSSWWHDS